MRGARESNSRRIGNRRETALSPRSTWPGNSLRSSDQLAVRCIRPRISGPAMSRTEWCGDDGRITLLTLGFGVVLVALIAVIVAASSIHLERKSLFVLADLAAVRAADALAEARSYAEGDTAG